MDECGALLTAWREGDADAGDELVRRHFKVVVRFFRSKLGDEIDDIVQQTFADAVRARDTMGPAGFRAYLLGIARHRLFDHLRNKAARGGSFDPMSVTLADIGTSVSQRVARDHDAELMLLAMRTLPVEFQIVLELAYWEELPGAEIAEIVGVSPHTVRSRLARARDALREALLRSKGARESIARTVARLASDPSFDHPARDG